MATIAYIILFLTLSSTTIHARESQFFAKVSSNNNPKQTQPQEVVPYGHESGQLPPSATNNNNDKEINLPKYLPKNYNPVAYTTPIHSTTQDIPEEYRQEPDAYQYNGESSMYNSQKQQGFEDVRFMDTEEDGGNNMYNNKQEVVGTNGGNMYNYEKQEVGTNDENMYYNNPGGNGYNSQKQGFEDTRFMETENGDNMYNSQKQLWRPENYNPVAYTTPIHSTTQDIPEEYRQEPAAYRYNGESSMYNSQKQQQQQQQQGFEDARFMDTEEDGANNMYNNKQEVVGTNGGNMYNYEKQDVGTNDENMYNYEKQGMSDTRLLDNGKYYYSPGGNGYNSEKQGLEDTRFMETENGDNMYNSQKQGMGEYGTSNNANMYNSGKQGMSDTRFVENGKYYYDINMEKNANINMNSRGFNSRNEYNTQGYYGNNENENSYDRYNSNGGYQNQEEFQGEQFNP